jgi:pyruvate dehydrogenase (quinone)
MDSWTRARRALPIIAIAGDVETALIDTSALEELNPYKFFEAASLYTGRLVNPEQARSIINTAILTAVLEKGPTVISIPGDIASADVADQSSEITIPNPPILRPSDADLDQLVKMIDDAKSVAIFGGDGCRDARDEVVQLAGKLKAPVGYSFRGKQWLEHDNPNAVGMTGCSVTAEPTALFMRPICCCCSALIFPSRNFCPAIV